MTTASELDDRPEVDTPRPLELRILGPLRVWREGVEVSAGPRLQRLVLGILLARVGSPISMSQLIDLVWGDHPPTSAVNTIHKYVGALRRVLEPDVGPREPGHWLLRHGSGYRFVAGADVLDLAAFRQAEAGARRTLDSDDEAALRCYTDALRLWHGPAGGGLANTVPSQTMFATLDREYLSLATSAARLARRLERSQFVLDVLWSAADVGPLHEPLHAELVANLALAGQRSDAVVAFRAVRDRLKRELGIDPGPALMLAYRRIGAEAASTPQDQTMPADPWRERPAQLPVDPPFFVGRTEILAELTGLLTGPQPGPPVIAFHGMPGVGKSALAVHLAHRITSNYPDGQLRLDLCGFADSAGALTAEQALRDLITGLGVPPGSIPEGRQAMAGLYRTVLRGRRVLVVLDNARSVDQIVDLLPGSDGCLALVTSRQRLTALRACAGAYLVKVDLPSRDEARACFVRHLGARPVTPDTSALDVVIERCGRLPLALAYAGARAAGDTVPLRERIEASGVAELAVDQAFANSYRQLSTAAADVFRSLAPTLTPGRHVTADQVAGRTAQSVPIVHGLLDELHEVGLLEEHRPGRYRCHVLVRAYAAQLSAAS